MAYPQAIHLPFNQAVLHDAFTIGTPDRDPADQPGYWLVLRAGELVVREENGAVSLPYGPFPIPGPWAVAPVFVGTWLGRPLRAARLEPEAALPEPFVPIPASYRRSLDDRMLTLAGVARQILHWRDRSRICPACGGRPREIPGSWGARCPACAREYYPRLHPAIIVLITRGDEFLLVRKPEWPAGQYGLVAGYVEFAESLEECVVREVAEETGLAVTDIRYLCSQNWPFPSQIMAGFSACYAGGEIVVDRRELSDVGWFSADRLPPLLPPSPSIARHLIEHYAPGLAALRAAAKS